MTITLTLNLIGISLILAETVFDVRRVRSVKGSHQRYVYSTIRRILGWSVIGIIAAVTFTCFAVDHLYFGGFFNLFMLYFIVRMELRRKGDDDDWFNGRWKKLKNGAKRAVKKLAASLTPPTLVPSPIAG